MSVRLLLNLCRNLIPNVMEFGDGAFGSEVEPSRMGLLPLLNRPQRAPLPLLPGANTAGRWPSVNQKQVLATESESALILTFPGPRTGEVNLYINKPPGYGVCQSSPNSGGDAEQSR